MKSQRNHIQIIPVVLLCILCRAGLMFAPGALAQNAPVTTIPAIGNATPGQVAVPITVTGFSNIGACSLCFDYEYAGLHFVQGVANPALAGCAVGDASLGNGKHRVTIGWFGSGTSLPDGSVIMTITFTYISGITALEFYDNGPSCEYADGSYNVLNDIPQNAYYINGYVCGQLANPGNISGSAAVCLGESGVAYSVSSLANATAYNWSVPAGASVTTGNGTNSILVDFGPGSVSGIVSVFGSNICGNGPAAQLSVTVNPPPVANAGSDVSIPFGTSTTLTAASGGSGSFSYHWSPETLLVNPDLQQVQTVNLTSTAVFTVKVTNLASQCFSTDEVVVTITGGPLNTNPVASPTAVCQGTSAQLFSNAGGGSGNYTYAWTCTPAGVPPWTSTLANPVVTPDITTVYHLVLNDGFNTASGNTTVTVNPLPTAFISGGDTLCGTGNSTTLTVDLTGTPPWSFYYTNGVNTWHVAAQMTSPGFITATEEGIYTVLVVADTYCIGTTSGAAIVAVNPVPPTPVISVNGSDLFSTGCCGNQWYKEGVPIAGANGQTFTPSKTAHYYDIVTIDGCPSDTSNTIYFIMTGTGGYSTTDNFFLEPNPAHDFCRIIAQNDPEEKTQIGIWSVAGQLECSFIWDPSTDGRIRQFDISNLHPGIYFVTVAGSTARTVRKLIVR